MRNIVVKGASGHAKVVIDAIEKQGGFQIVGLLDRFKAAGTRVFGYEILGQAEDLPALIEKHDIHGGVVALGDNRIRKEAVGRIEKAVPGFRFETVVHPSAAVARGVELGRGVVLLAGTVVNSDANIGAFCYLNTGATLDHESIMAPYASLSPGVVTGGLVEIGEGADICIGAILADRISVGPWSVVGAGATVLSSLPGETLAYGTPAKAVRPELGNG